MDKHDKQDNYQNRMVLRPVKDRKSPSKDVL